MDDDDYDDGYGDILIYWYVCKKSKIMKTKPYIPNKTLKEAKNEWSTVCSWNLLAGQ